MHFHLHVPLCSKEKEINGLLHNVDDQAAEIAALQKKVRELEAKVEELEEDLENEQNNRHRVSPCTSFSQPFKSSYQGIYLGCIYIHCYFFQFLFNIPLKNFQELILLLLFFFWGGGGGGS